MAFEALRAKYLPNVDPDNTIAYAGYGQAVSMGEILRRCGDDADPRQRAEDTQRPWPATTRRSSSTTSISATRPTTIRR